MSHIFFSATDNLMWIEGAYAVDLTTGLRSFLNEDATVEITLLDADGEELTGETWPLAFTYIAGSEGVFLGVARDSLVWAPGDHPQGRLVLDNGTDQRVEAVVDIIVQASRAA